MGNIFKTGENVFKENIGDQFVRIGWQKEVEKGLDMKDLMNFGYISGYKYSADDLVKICRGNSLSEVYVFPIVFLYRQYLELLLKNIVTQLQQIQKISIPSGNLHDLNAIWNYISPILKHDPHLSDEQIEFVGEVVGEFHKIDPKSSNFRYFFRYGNKLTLNNNVVVDIDLMESEINKVDTILYHTYGM